MSTIKEMYNRVASLDLRNEVPVLIERTKDEIILFNQAQMYQDQVDKNGLAISPEYASESYERAKMDMNPNLSPGRVDLNLTGEFYSSFNVVVSKDEFEVFASDLKSIQIEDKYGSDIFGLTAESKKSYSFGAFLDAIKTYIENVSGLRFS